MASRKEVPTIREIEFSKLENVNKSKKEMKQWNIYRHPTTTKRVPSISKLRKLISEFFEQHVVTATTPVFDYPTVTELALFLGYPNQKKLFYDINNPVVPEYSDELARAVDQIQDLMQRKQMDVGASGKDYRGIATALERQDKISASVAPDEASNVKLTISVEAKTKIDNLIADGIANIFGTKEVIESDFEEVKEEVQHDEL